MLKRFLTLFLLSTLISCGQLFYEKGNVESAIGDKINKNCVVDQNCSLKIKDVTWFEWDRMIYFPAGYTAPDINAVIGQNHFNERRFGLSTTLVFLKGDRIVYSEENYRDVEKNNAGDIYFSADGSATRHLEFMPADAFSVDKLKETNGEYYWLHRL